jgi:uncharacterized protein (TIGR03118 family)
MGWLEREVLMSRRYSTSARAVAVAAGLVAAPAFAAQPLSDAQLGASSAGAGFSITNQVSDQMGAAAITDPNLVNAWGLSQGPGTLLWVANNGSNTSTIYDPGSFAKAPLTVTTPDAPTGTTFVNVAGAFKISSGAASGRSLFAFATESGMIAGWNPAVSQGAAVVAVDQSGQGSVFKGLTLGLNQDTHLLFAADFGTGMVEAFDPSFNKVTSFTDPNLPAGYAPFNVQNLNGLLYVAFAQKAPGSRDETHGFGLGVVDVFDMNGNLIKRLITNGRLNAPWGLAIAPKSFGQFAGALLVGNFGNGRIGAYDPNTGQFLGKITDANGTPLAIDGLWALRSGANGTLTFSAGPQDESHGLLGSLAPASTGAMWSAPEVATMVEMPRR